MTPKIFSRVLAAVLALSVIGGGAGYYLASTGLSSGTAALSQKLGEEELINEKLTKLADLDKQFHRLQPVLAQLDNALPASKEQSELALQLQTLAQSSGLTIDAINFSASDVPGPTSQTVKAGDALAIPVTFKLHGSYDQLQAFLVRQEKLDRYTSITQLNIAGAGNSLDFAVSLNAYMKP